MKLFHHANGETTRETRHLWACYEVAYTAVDFTAAATFLIGSIMFYWSSLNTPAVTLFVIGSLCFALKPTIRLVRELHLMRKRDYADLAKREES
ncbi:YrhK family protein [Pseudoroseicyclus aestuarii]|uniref:YrhK-like protein n=1 Tax=Pseudoroseicyclus aestuarii TaxID=1795041 RepID=A0A318SQF3_9RHOB|nr:YrhK family protein [Pseudoroseicyclus aestuarii]PYE83902.1 YrhK-like protein [Pseudoroseicyclus aestuarii]